MLAYYPLEHTYYMLAHDIIPTTFALPTLASLIPFATSKPSNKLVTLNKGAFGMWSCRFWAAYIILQFVHMKEDFNLLKIREKAVSKSKVRASAGSRAYASLSLFSRLSAILQRRRSSTGGGMRSGASLWPIRPTCRRRFIGACRISRFSFRCRCSSCGRRGAVLPPVPVPRRQAANVITFHRGNRLASRGVLRRTTGFMAMHAFWSCLFLFMLLWSGFLHYHYAIRWNP